MTTVEAALAHPRVMRIAQVLHERPGAVISDDAVSQHAAVAVIMRLADDDDVELLMIERAAYAGDPWSGHIALPGGRHEPADISLQHTAMRETREETEIDLAAVGRPIGTLDDVHPRTPRLPPLIIRPFVFVVPRDVTVVASYEVAAAFWVPLPLLEHPSATGEATFTDRGVERTERSFRLGEHVIWGLTERILRQFIGYSHDAADGEGESRATG